MSDWPEAIQLNDSQELAYLALEDRGLDIDDISDPDNPTLSAHFGPGDSECAPQELFADEVALIKLGTVDALISGGECGVVGVDFTDSSDLEFVDRISIPFGLAEEVAVTESADGLNRMLYVASYWQGLQIFEVVGDCDASGCEVNERGSIGADDEWGASLAVWVEEGEEQTLAHVASTNGLQIVDVTNPDLPTLEGRYDTNPENDPLEVLVDVPQDVVVSGDLAFVPIWIGGFLVIDVTDPTNPLLAQPVIPASEGSAFFKVEVSSRDNRIYVTEGLYGVAVFIQNPDRAPDAGPLLPEPEARFPIGEGDSDCNFVDGSGVSTNCWAWGIDEVGELVGVTYGVLDSSLSGGYQLITMPPTHSVGGAVLKTLRATPVPEPHLLLLQGVGVLAVAGLGRLRRRR